MAGVANWPRSPARSWTRWVTSSSGRGRRSWALWATPRPTCTATSPRGTTATRWSSGFRERPTALSVPAGLRLPLESLPLRAQVRRRLPRAIFEGRPSCDGRTGARRGGRGRTPPRRPRRAPRARGASVSRVHGGPPTQDGARAGLVRVFLIRGGCGGDDCDRARRDQDDLEPQQLG